MAPPSVTLLSSRPEINILKRTFMDCYMLQDDEGISAQARRGERRLLVLNHTTIAHPCHHILISVL